MARRTLRRAGLALVALAAACSPGDGPGNPLASRDLKGEFGKRLQAYYEAWSGDAASAAPGEAERRAEKDLKAFVDRNDAREFLVEEASGARRSFAFRERLLRMAMEPAAPPTP